MMKIESLFLFCFLVFIFLFTSVSGTSSNKSDECADAKKCSNDGGVLLPAWKPVHGFETWEKILRAAIYLLALFYLFAGVSIIADIFMESIEVITSKTYIKTYPSGKTYEVKVWNETVANLTLMALGSSAPEILLATIEIVGNDFYAGELGPGTTVGSAAFNLLVISAVCVSAITGGDTKKINNLPVFLCTSIWSLFAYVWLYLIIAVISKKRIDIWEGALTLLFFLIFIVNAYLIDLYGHHLVTFVETKILSAQPVDDAAANGAPSNATSMHSIENGYGSAHFDNLNSTTNLHKTESARGAKGNSAAVAKGKDLRSQIFEIISGNKVKYAQNSKLFKEKSIQEIRSLMMEGRGKAYYRKHKADIEAKKREYEVLVDTMMKNMQSIDRISSERNIVFSDPLTTKFPESVGVARILLCREGPFTQTTTRCRYRTVDGKAISDKTAELKVDESADYIHCEGTVTFAPNEISKPIFVEICDDAEYEEDEDFYIELWELEEIPVRDVDYQPPTLKDKRIQCVILDDDHFGVFEFNEPEVEVFENAGIVSLTLLRLKGCQGHIRVFFEVESGTAVQDSDFKLSGQQFVDFMDKQLESDIEIELLNNLALDKSTPKSFTVRLKGVQLQSSDENLTEESKPLIGPCNQCVVNIGPLGQSEDSMQLLIEAADDGPNDSYCEQFKNIMKVREDDDLESRFTCCEIFTFLLLLPFKIAFVIVPPPGLWGGYPCFVAAIVVIGLMTALIGDLATFFGCTVGLKDSVTAITVVALGTSLPDTFASRVAAQNDKYADSSIGNITGSNAVNVFLGVGVAWFVAAVYNKAKRDEEFEVEEGDLGLSVAVFLILAIIGFAVLICRRIILKAELGGPEIPKWVSVVTLVSLWVIYITISTANAYCLF